MTLLLLLAGLVQDAEAARLRDLVRELTDDAVQVRADAARKIQALPARLLPELEAEAKRHPEPEVEAVVARLRIPAPWAGILRGTLGEARAAYDRISDPTHPGREDAIRKAQADLEALPPEPAAEALEGLLGLAEEETRQFALRCMIRTPPRDPRILAPFLGAAKTTGLAAEILIRMNDASLVPVAVDLFCEEGPGTLGAARLLEHFGAGAEWPRVAAALKTHAGLLTWGIRILARSGPGAERGLLELLSAAGHARVLEIAQALADLECESAAGPVRKALEDAGIEKGERDRILRRLRDPVWAREWLAEARRDPNRLWTLSMDELAGIGGAGLRTEVLSWLLSARQPVVVQTKLLPLLGSVGKREDAAFLATALADGQLRDLAADAMDRIGDPDQARALFRAFADASSSTRLHRIALSLPPEPLEDDLLRLLADPDRGSTKLEAAFALVRRRPSDRLREALLGALRNPRPAWVRRRPELVRALADVATGDEVARLRADGDPALREAGEILAARRAPPDEEALERLVRRAHVTGFDWTREEESAFVAAAKPEHWGPMAELARRRNHPEGDPAFRAVALAARPEALDLYRRVLARHPKHVGTPPVYGKACSLAAAALGRLGDRESIPALRSLLRSANPLDRATAAGALARLGDLESLPRLVRLVDDPEELLVPDERHRSEFRDVPIRRVWHAAMEAVETLTGTRIEAPSVAERRERFLELHR